MENSLYYTQNMQFQEDDYRMRTGNAPAVMDVLRRATLNKRVDLAWSDDDGAAPVQLKIK